MSEVKILIIEDEPKMASFIKMGLEDADYSADIAYDGMTGKSLALSNKYDLILTDVTLPLLNGFQVCQAIRKNNHNIPIMLLSSLERTEDKLQGFESGADDYLIKPFDFKELLARIKALLRRIQNNPVSSDIIKIANLEINRDSKVVSRSDSPIILSAKEYALLEYLALNRNRVINRTELTEKVWGEGSDTSTNIVDVYINFLRKKMDSNYAPHLIHTRVGFGYILHE